MSIAEPDLTDDAFLGDALRILQPRDAYRAGLDAVLLAAAIPAGDGLCQVLDAGAGVGVVGLSVARRCPAAHVTLVEIAPELAALARRNAERNQLIDRVHIVASDVGTGGASFNSSGLQPASFDHVAANPPYYVDARSSSSPSALKARAHGMSEGGLDAWLRFLATAAKSGGTATVIHRAAALPELIAAMIPRFGALKVLPIHPRAGEPANRIIVQGIKGSRAPLLILPGLILHGDGQAFRAEIDHILRHGAPLVL